MLYETLQELAAFLRKGQAVQVSKCVNSFMTETKSQIIPQHIHQKIQLKPLNVQCSLYSKSK